MRRAGLLLWIVLAIVPDLGAAAETLRLVAEEMAPLSMAGPGKDGVTGIATEVIDTALARSRISRTVSLYPWAQAYDMALHRHDTCIYSTSRTEERIPRFKWVGPVVHDRWVLFGRIDGPAPATLDEAHGASIGGHYAGALTAYLESLGFVVDKKNDYHSNMVLVAEHRLDYTAAGLLAGAYAISRDKDLADIVPVLAFKDSDLYLACNRSVPDRVVDRLNAALTRMNADGTTAAILRRYQ